MRLVDDFRNIISDSKMKIILKEDFINIVNFDRIITLENEKIIVKDESKKIKVSGKNLSIIKLLDNEILAKGCLNKIEFSE